MPACTAELQLREEVVEEEDGKIFVYIATALSQQRGPEPELNLLSHFCSLT